MINQVQIPVFWSIADPLDTIAKGSDSIGRCLPILSLPWIVSVKLVTHLTHFKDLIGWSERQRTPTMTLKSAWNCWSSLALTPTYNDA